MDMHQKALVYAAADVRNIQVDMYPHGGSFDSFDVAVLANHREYLGLLKDEAVTNMTLQEKRKRPATGVPSQRVGRSRLRSLALLSKVSAYGRLQWGGRCSLLTCTPQTQQEAVVARLDVGSCLFYLPSDTKRNKINGPMYLQPGGSVEPVGRRTRLISPFSPFCKGASGHTFLGPGCLTTNKFTQKSAC